MSLHACRECGRKISDQAWTCPGCGAPRPAIAEFRGTGGEWRSRAEFLGLPLVHLAIGRDSRGKLRVAKGWLAVGQFAIGVVTVAQFGVGLLAVGQFALGALVLGQFAGGALVGVGQFATGAAFSLGMLSVGGEPLGKLVLRTAPAVSAAFGALLLVLDLEILRRKLFPRREGRVGAA